MAKRMPGFYWVKHRGKWTIGQLNIGNDYDETAEWWQLFPTGCEKSRGTFDTCDFEKIGSKINPPKGE